MVVIHDPELLGETNDATGSTRGEFLSKLSEKVFSGGFAFGGCSSANISAENLGGKFAVFEHARSVLIIDPVKAVQILD